MFRNLLDVIDTLLRAQKTPLVPVKTETIDVMSLERRLLYSAVPLLEPPQNVSQADVDLLSSESSEFASPDDSDSSLASQATEAEVNLTTIANESEDSTTQLRRELIFIDSGVEDFEQLLAEALANTDSKRELEIVLLSPDRDGVEHISQILAQRSNLDAVHIVSHGSAGRVQLGNVELNSQSLAGYAGQIASWSSALNTHADFLFYGCDLANGDGKDLLESLAALTDADVAASDDLTGHADLGGDWDLEYATGHIDVEAYFFASTDHDWLGVLDLYTVTNTLDDGSVGSLRWAIAQSNASTTVDDTINFAISGTVVHTINIGSTLTISDTVTINATTDDSFATNSNRPAIILDGNNSFTGGGFVLTSTADGTTIRGFVIRDFSGDGIEIQANSNGNTIAGNYIGRLTTSGVAAAAGEENTAAGIRVLGASNLIGGITAADRNVIAGNTLYGVSLETATATGNTIAGNYIGLEASGTVMLGNGNDGVFIIDGASNNTIGGATTAHRNVIAGNSDGVQIGGTAGGSNSNIVRNNYIGTDYTGTIDFGNNDDGVDIDNAALNNQVIGNLISGNTGDGIDLGDAGASTGTVIQGNLIGTEAGGVSSLGNAGHGILIGNGGTANNTIIGGTTAGQGNTIAFNAGDGIFIPASTSVAIVGNSIHSNTQLGIDLGINGVNANDPAPDGDGGANNLQNFPVLTRAVTNAGSRLAVGGTFASVASTWFRIEIFSNTAGDASGNGEGQSYLGFVNVRTDATGNATWGTEIMANVATGAVISATATRLDASLNPVETSEFAANVTAVNQTLIVTNTNDTINGTITSVSALIATPGGDGISLREAITAANNTVGIDLITFNIAGAGVHTISVGATPLPGITSTLVIDGWSELDYAGTPVIELNGNNLGTSLEGLFLSGANAGGSTIRGLTINRFTGHGIEISASSNNVIDGNWVGLNNTGTVASANAEHGIHAFNSIGNLIGGTTAASRNVVSGNSQQGIFFDNVDFSTISGNYVGTNAAGTGDVNGSVADTFKSGVFIQNGSSNNIIGGFTAGARNVLSGNNHFGFEVLNATSQNNLLVGNYIGTDATGLVALGNINGGATFWGAGTGNVFGGSAVGARNVIAGNTFSGIVVGNATSGATIQGNYIGVGGDGLTLIGNGSSGVKVEGGSIGTRIGTNADGSNDAAERNIISGNTYGVRITDSGTTGTVIAGNTIGLAADGNTIVANSSYGVSVMSSAGAVMIGGTTSVSRNIISGNAGFGVYFDSTTSGSSVLSNYIGTDLTGMSARANLDGIWLDGSFNNTIGQVGAGNLISGNTYYGLTVDAATATGNVIRSNLIGTNAAGTGSLGNGAQGILISNGASSTSIGGTTAGQGNTIAFNAGDGIHVAAGTANSILGNSIYSNTDQGIDLGLNGLGTNDLNDSDGGANNLQNFPVISYAVTNGGTIAVGGSLNSEASKTYRIEFFANSTSDNEGQRYVGFTTVTTSAGSPFTASFNTTLSSSVSVGEYITATATSPTNETSEFSAAFQATNPTGLWLSTANNATAGGITWDANDTTQFGDPNLSFEPGTTTGTLFATNFDLDNFGGGVGNLNGLHYVSRTVTVGSANAVTLMPGDVLFSTAQNETLGGVAISSNDIALFRPTTPGNYSAGTFSILLQNPMAGNSTRDFALVETATVVGGVTLNSGDFLLTASSGTYDKDVTRYQAIDVGPGTTSGTRTEFIDGASAGIGFGAKIFGLELVQANATLGGTALSAGQLLISLDGNDTVGTNDLSVTTYDIFTLTVTATGTGTSSGTAAMLMQGLDVGLTAGGEEFDAIALLPLNNSPVLDSSKSPSLAAINEDAGAPSGAMGTLISSLVDFASPGGQVDNVTDLDTSPLLGIALTAADTANGTWYYSTNNGTNWNALGAVATNNARLLAADASTRIYFQPNANYNGTLASAVTFRAWDQTIGANGGAADTSSNGGATPFSTATDSASLVINAVNDAPTFTTGAGTGKVTTAISGNWDGASATAIQPDGKILVVGGYNSGTTTEPFIARYNADGTLDTSFGTGGIVTMSLGASHDAFTSLALQADGKILAAGYSQNGATNDFAVVRFNANGTLDTSFDGDGIALIDLAGGHDYANGIAVQTDGKILLGGYATVAGNEDFALVRLNASGSLDTSFDTDGKVTTAIGAGVDRANGLALQSDGKVVLVGYSHNGTNEDVAIVRYNTNGSLDTSFDSDGKRTVAVGSGYDVANAVALQTDGKIVVAGDSLIGATPDFTVLRFNTDGSLDTSFDTDGIATIAVGASSDYSKAMAIQPDGRIIVVGESFNGANNDVAVVRLNANGSADTSFDTDGKLTTAIGTATDTAAGIALQSDGKLVVAGYATFASGDNTVVRYNTNGSLDTSFGATSTLNGTPTYTEGTSPVVLDSNVTIFDAELSASNNFNGATLTLVRSGGANSQDVLSATGTLASISAASGNVVVGGTTIGTYTNASGTLVLTFNASATNALVNSAMQQIAYSNSSNAPPASALIDWTFNDNNSGAQGSGGALSASGSVVVNITATNDAPTLTTFSSPVVTINEDTQATITFADLLAAGNEADVDGTVTAFVVKTVSSGTLLIGTSAGTATAWAAGTNDTIDATRQAYWTGALDSNGTLNSFTVVAKDDGGLESTTPVQVQISATPVNDAPIRTAGSVNNLTVLEDSGFTSLGFGSLAYGPGGGVDESGQTLTYNVTAVPTGLGSVYLADGTTLVTTSSVLTLTELRGLQFRTTTNSTGTSGFQFNPTDSGGTANGGSDNFSEFVLITVTQVNDAPTLNASALNPTFTEAAGLGTQAAAVNVFGSAAVSTIEAGQRITGLTFTISGLLDGSNEVIVVDGRTIALGANSSGTTVTNGLAYSSTVSGGTATIVLSGGSLTTAATQTMVNNVTYQNTNTDNPAAGNRVVTLTQIKDNGGTTNGGSDTTTLSIASTVAVNSVNDQAAFTALNGTPAFTEGGSAVVLDSDVTILDAELSAANNFSGATLTLVRNGGANSQDVYSATGTLSALTQGGSLVVGGTTIGTVTTNSAGTLVLTFNANATNALVNSAMQQIAYSNSSDAPPASVQIDWNFNDGNSGSQGSGGALPATGSTTVSITSVNDEQVLATNAGRTVNENSTGNAISNTQLLTTDVDNTTSQLVYTITTATSNGTLRRSGIALSVSSTFTQADINAGLITYDHNGSETSSDSFSVSVDDGTGSASTGTFNITVTPVNDNNPVITSNGGGATAAINVAENSTAVTTVTATDGDLPGQTLTYSISGIDAGLFNIDLNTGVLTFASGRNRESHSDFDSNGIYEVTVQVSDGTLTDSQDISVTITDVDEFDVTIPTDSNAAINEVDENVAIGTTVGLTANAFDLDATNNTITYSLTSNPSGLFQIDANTGVVTTAAAIDRETHGALRSITVQAASSDGSTQTQSFNITINDLDEFNVSIPTDSDAAVNEVDENVIVGTTV
ncbi:MAG: DUF4347 domain-containing protein, partial [Pirellulaceae bacterium]